MPLTVLVAPSGFKESLGVRQVTDAIATGVLRGRTTARVLKAPMVDGGEGTVEALVDATGGVVHRTTVAGPIGLEVPSFYGIMGGTGPRTAIIEIAAAAGLSLVPRDSRDPTVTTSRGVGELILAALDRDPDRLLIGCGDSGINDAGAGMLQALGARLLDKDGKQIGDGGGELRRLVRIDISDLDNRLARVRIDAAVNWHNVLLGERGVARIFGPQKGATGEQVKVLDEGLERFAEVMRADLGVDVGTGPGTGASGGLGAAILGGLGGRLHPRYDIVMQYLAFDDMLIEADLVITAEGSLDHQTPFGKVPAEVGRRAARLGIPVIALAGSLGAGVTDNLAHGIDAFTSIVKRPCSLDDAIAQGHPLLVAAAEQAMRMIGVGHDLGERKGRSDSENARFVAGNPSRIGNSTCGPFPRKSFERISSVRSAP